MTRYFMRDTPLCQMEQQMMTTRPILSPEAMADAIPVSNIAEMTWSAHTA